MVEPCTWRDWLPSAWTVHQVPDPPLITRVELADSLRAENLNVSERTIRYWEQTGLLPHPTRGEQAGHGQGGPGLYPYWMPTVIRQLVHLRSADAKERLGAEEIRQRMHDMFDACVIAHVAVHRGLRLQELQILPHDASTPRMPKELHVALTSYFMDTKSRDGRPARITISVQDDQGQKLWGYDVALPVRPESPSDT